ncbi:MAG: hypothetical protein K9N35_10210 [Candidatus Marinimicrobia bacterium]|nr:hypothetical protein [Candidatus Neomarinimicrobiota bacterium]
MKRSNLALLVMLVLSGAVFGQGGNPEVKVRITATIEDYIEMITLSDIDVGTVVAGEDYLRLNARNDPGAGIIKINGRANASVQINFSAQVEMINLSSNTSLTVNYNVSGNGENNQSASDVFTTNPMTVVLNHNGEYYLWIGCSFSLQDLVPGQYDGDFVVEVDYI